jgi:hypothetical protein
MNEPRGNALILLQSRDLPEGKGECCTPCGNNPNLLIIDINVSPQTTLLVKHLFHTNPEV